MTKRNIVCELTDASPSVQSMWYGDEDVISPPEPKLVIDLGQLFSDAHALHDTVFQFLTEHGLDAERASLMARRLIVALPTLHPATLGVVVQSTGAGHWQIVAERGQ
jgi:hypothetical protein